MSELDLLADCLKDATKERDELAAALVQKDTVISDLTESLGEAIYDEPELRSKLDKQRQRIAELVSLLDEVDTELICGDYSPTQCDCDPSVGLENCLICRVRDAAGVFDRQAREPAGAVNPGRPNNVWTCSTSSKRRSRLPNTCRA